MPTKELRAWIGSMFVIGFDGRSINSSLDDLIQRYHPAAAVLFQRNVSEVVQLWELTRALSKRRLMVGIDHEGGRVQRLGEPVTPTPAMAGLGMTRSPRLARELGQVHGAELAALGFHLNFAPVADVLTNARNEVIGDRSLGEDPEVVGQLASAYVHGLQEHRVAGCAKHFPGHGATREDSHVSLPVCDEDKETLRGVHMAPFRKLLDAGVGMVMTAHVTYKDLDPTRPATLSSRLIQDELRTGLGFNGVVITDDLKMAALARWDMEDRVLMALEAGADMLMICHDRDSQIAAFEAVYKAVDGRIIKKERIQKSAERVQKLREWLHLGTERAAKNREHLLSVLGSSEHRRKVSAIPVLD